MVWESAAISAGGSLLGGLLGNSSAKKAAKQQMAFQERMDNTKYQRSTADMRAAGINPMLAINNGVGGAPSGALARTSENVIEPAVNSALNARRNSAEVENMRQQNENLQSQNELNKAATAKTIAEAAQTTAQTTKLGADPKHIIGDMLKATGTSGKSIIDKAKKYEFRSWDDIKKDPLKNFKGLFNNSAKSTKKTLKPGNSTPLAIPSLKQLNHR